MWGQAAELVPGDDVEGGFDGEFARTVAREHFASDVSEADAVTVGEKADVRRQKIADSGERVIRAGGGDTFGGFEERLFEMGATARPFGDFQASAEFRVAMIDRMREQPNEPGGAGGAFDKLGRADQQAENNAHQGGSGDIAGSDVHDQFGTSGDRACVRADHLIEAQGMAEFLFEQRFEIVAINLREERIETARERGGGETRESSGF